MISNKYELVFGSFCWVKKALVKQTKRRQNEGNLIYSERHKILSEQRKEDGNRRESSWSEEKHIHRRAAGSRRDGFVLLF